MLRSLPAGAAERKRLDQIRADRARLEQQLAELREARLPVDEAVEHFMSMLANSRDLANTQLQYITHPGQVQHPELTLGLLALLVPDIEARVRTLFETMTDKPGLPAQKRKEQAAALEAKLAETKRREISELVRLERSELLVELPTDLDVGLLLEAWDE